MIQIEAGPCVVLLGQPAGASAKQTGHISEELKLAHLSPGAALPVSDQTGRDEIGTFGQWRCSSHDIPLRLLGRITSELSTDSAVSAGQQELAEPLHR